MITKEQAFGMYKHIAKIYYINDGHPEIKYDWNKRTNEGSKNLYAHDFILYLNSNMKGN